MEMSKDALIQVKLGDFGTSSSLPEELKQSDSLIWLKEPPPQTAQSEFCNRRYYWIMPMAKKRSPAEMNETFDQSRVVEFMLDSATHNGAPVQYIQTHISHVFLAGDYAYKMKKAIKLPFVDFTTLDARLMACRGELQVNRRTAPDIYLNFVAVTQSADTLRLDGPGKAVDYLVRMRRFPQDCLLDRIAAEARLTPALVRGIADKAAELHLLAARRKSGSLSEDFGITANNLLLRLVATECSDATRTRIHRFEKLVRSTLDTCLPEIRARARHGAVRHGHGDLHLRNLCVYNGEVRLFDAIEFEPKFSHIDVLYDIAFVIMDLLHRGCRSEAIMMLSRYLSATRDYSGIDNLRLFMAVRAGIRALVALLGDGANRDDQALEYLDLAISILDRPGTRRLIAIGGRSGTGKSTLALALAPALASAPDIVVLRADEMRKRLFATAPESKLPQSAYQSSVTKDVYRRLFRDAERIVRNGSTAILDASFLDPENRSRFLALGRKLDVPASGIWLTAPTEVLTERLEKRFNDASDADPAVMLRQSDLALPKWWHAVSTDQPLASVLTEALVHLATDQDQFGCHADRYSDPAVTLTKA